MPSNGYNTALWIFFIPFILIEVPSNLIMGLPRVRPNLFLGVNMLILGVIATCQGLTQSYGGLLVLRFLMGIFEATLPAGWSPMCFMLPGADTNRGCILDQRILYSRSDVTPVRLLLLLRNARTLH